MSAQMPASPNVMQQWFQSLSFPKQLAVWGGAGLVVTGYGVTHLPSPIELLGWAGVVGAGLWGVRRFWRSSIPLDQNVTRSLTLEQVKRAIAQTKTQLEQLVSESSNGPALQERYTAQLADIKQSLGRETLELQIVGTRAVGKTTLGQLLEGQSRERLQQHWSFAGLDGICAEVVGTVAVEALKDADVVLFVVQGDLTQGEWAALQQLQAQHKRVLLLFNKQDLYLPTQAELLLEQIKQRVQGIVAPEDVMAIATSPAPLKVRRHQPDGLYQDSWETPQPQIQPLLNRIETVAAQEVKQLVLQRAYQHTIAVQTTLQNELNQLRRDRALPLIERYQWIAAGAAFANPLPFLDMVATAAITGKMIQELAKTYQIQLSLNRATEIAGVLVKTLIQMGVVEASSQLLSTVLKGNVATYVVGGTLQGVGAAYFTRMAGLSLIELFEVHLASEAVWQLNRAVLGQIVRRVFDQNQRLDVFKDLVHQTVSRFKPESEAAMNLV
jgi:uncharacterized protein